VLAVPAARRLWLAGVGAGVMRWLEILAFGLYALEGAGTALDVALTSFARFLPLLLVAGPAAVLAERAEPRRLLVASYLGMAGVSALGAAAAAAGLLGFGHVLLLALAAGVFWCVEIPVRRTLLAEAGGPERVAVSMGLEMVTTHLTRLAGPPIGGALIAWAGMPGVLALGAVLYLTGAVLVAGVAPASVRRPAGGAGLRLLAGLAEGVALVRAEPRLLAIAALTVVFNLFGLPYLGLVPVLAAEELGLGPVGTGVLAAGEGVGAVAATLAILALARPRWFGPIFGLGCALFFAAEAALALAPTGAAGFAVLLAAGLGMAGFSAMQATIPLAVAPPALRVRVTGVVMVAIGSAPFGFLLAGALGDALGPRPAVAALGLAGLAATLAVLRRWPAMARPEPSGEEGAGGGL
jgi:predicted MFS family arabinose efflux permease